MIPDLSDPEQRAAYRRELGAVAVWPRRTGIALAVTGGLVALWQGSLETQPVPEAVLVALIATGGALMLVGIAQRTRYHRQRMTGAPPS